jgi:hypothetical protein
MLFARTFFFACDFSDLISAVVHARRFDFFAMLLPILFRTTSVISSNTVLTKACASGVFVAVENCGRVTLQAAPPLRRTWPRYRDRSVKAAAQFGS